MNYTKIQHEAARTIISFALGILIASAGLFFTGGTILMLEKILEAEECQKVSSYNDLRIKG